MNDRFCVLLVLEHLENSRKNAENSKFNFNSKKKRFSKHLSVTVFGNLLSTFWRKIVSFGTVVGLGYKKSLNCPFLLKYQYIGKGSLFFIKIGPDT